MILRACDIQEFINRNKKREVVCYGVGNWLSILSDEYAYDIESVYSYAVDTNPALWGKKRRAGKRMIEVKPPDYLFQYASANTVILITSGKYYVNIYDLLEQKEKLKDIECYTVKLMELYEWDKETYSAEKIPSHHRMNQVPVIPKIIHYTWLSGEPLPESAKRCLDSWRKYAPDYEIVEWNAGNYDLMAHRYVRDAVASRKWGFAGDYIRLDVVYKYGGFYFDLDVELLKNIDDLRFNSAFCSFQTKFEVNLGSGFGAVKGHSVIKYLRDQYDEIDFLDINGMPNLQPSPVHQTKGMKNLGVEINGQFQIVQDCAIYPAIYFVPKSLLTGIVRKSPLSYAVHNFVGSWLDEFDQKQLKENRNNMMKEMARKNELIIREGGKI